MIKIVKAVHVIDKVLRLEFSDGTWGECDLAYVVSKNTVLTRPLADPSVFARFFLDAGALAWPNGLDLDPDSLRARLEASGSLHTRERAA